MKFIISFAIILFCLLFSCKKESEYRSTSIHDTIITPDTVIKKDTLIVKDTLMASPDTITHRKDSIVKITK
jgi:hypothetical protein